MYAVGVLYVNSNRGGGDYAKAREWFQKAAEAGDLLAMNNLGVYYSNGQGGVQDYHKAREWFQKAAEAGYAGFHVQLGHSICEQPKRRSKLRHSPRVVSESRRSRQRGC
jgi:TPR repeat protein